MSYCRHSFFRDEDGEVSASDVYMFQAAEYIECCACGLPEQRSTSVPGHKNSIHFSQKRNALAHLWKHRLYGHIVPQHAFDRLEEEITEEEIEETNKRTNKLKLAQSLEDDKPKEELLPEEVIEHDVEI